MSAYAQTGSAPGAASLSPYERYGIPPIQGPSGGWTPPKGAQRNDLSGQVPSNQIWAQAYNQASKQYGGNTQAQSFTMPGVFTSQGYNPTTGQYGPMSGGQSNAGNMAYNAIDRRPSPIQASATGVDGNPLQWQDAMTQREAFVGNLSQRLGQYNGGQQTGPVTFDPSQLLSQANDQLANGTFYNPFSQAAESQRAQQNPQAVGNFRQQVPYGDSLVQSYGPRSQPSAKQNPDAQRAMGNATQYMQGNFQNPFGNSPQANNPQPTWDQQTYDQFAPQNYDMRTATFAAPPQQGSPSRPSQAASAPSRSAARQSVSIFPSDTSDYFNPQPSSPPAPPEFMRSTGFPTRQLEDPTDLTPTDPIDFSNRQLAAEYAGSRRRSSQRVGTARPIEPPSQGTAYNPRANVQGVPSRRR
jgi:hypothetical protein